MSQMLQRYNNDRFKKEKNIKNKIDIFMGQKRNINYTVKRQVEVERHKKTRSV